MKILHVRSSGGLYGAEQVILNLARELNQMDCSNHIICLNHMKTNEQFALIKEAQKQKIEGTSVKCSGLIDEEAINAIRSYIREESVDVLHCHDYKACYYGLKATKGLSVKKVATNHLWTHANLKLRLYEMFEGILYNKFDHVVAVSEKIQKESKAFVWNKTKVSFIPNGIDVDKFHFEQVREVRESFRAGLGLNGQHILIGNLARLSVEKDHALLLRAFEELIQGFPEKDRLRLLIAGDGEEEGHLKQLAKELKIDSQCLFLGVRRDVPELLNSLDVYVQSSKREGLPMVILEAMAASAMILSTRAGGIPKVIHDKENGRLVDIGDQVALAQTLKEVVGNLEESKKLGQAARRSAVEHHSAKAMAEKYLEVYRG